MKLIQEYDTLDSAEAVKVNLQQRGILAHISIKSDGPIGWGVSKVYLWTVMDYQHQDATKYLNNISHEITTGLPPEEISKIQKQAKANVLTLIANFLVVVAILLLTVWGVYTFL